MSTDLDSYRTFPQKKIMYVIDSLANIGGTERVLIDKMNYLASNGFKVIVVTYQQGLHSFPYYISPLIKHIDTNTRFCLLYKYNFLIRIYKRWKLKNLYLQRMQEIVDNEIPDFIIITTYGIPTCGIVINLKTTAKFIAEAHIPKSKTAEGKANSKNPFRRLFDLIKNEYECHKISAFDLLVVLTKSAANDWIKIAKRCIVIPNLVTFYPETIPNKTMTKKRIISVGRLVPQKSFDKLINAFALIEDKCKDWHLDIFGSGENDKYTSSLVKLISKLHLHNQITIHPATDNIYDEYMASDFYVMSSRFEGMPLVLIEAMSCGLPCVSFRCKYGPEDIIEDGKTGLLVTNGNINELAEKILWMCKNEKERVIMGQNARESSKKYQASEIMPKWTDLFCDN